MSLWNRLTNQQQNALPFLFDSKEIQGIQVGDVVLMLSLTWSSRDCDSQRKVVATQQRRREYRYKPTPMTSLSISRIAAVSSTNIC